MIVPMILMKAPLGTSKLLIREASFLQFGTVPLQPDKGRGIVLNHEIKSAFGLSICHSGRRFSLSTHLSTLDKWCWCENYWITSYYQGDLNHFESYRITCCLSKASYSMGKIQAHCEKIPQASGWTKAYAKYVFWKRNTFFSLKSLSDFIAGTEKQLRGELMKVLKQTYRNLAIHRILK